jgi:V/A-type H+-transporting ATPase subunit E
MSKIKEGLSAVASEVLEDVRMEAEAIIKDSETEAKENLKKAMVQAEKEYSFILDDAMAKIETEKRGIESATEVETRNRLLNVKEELVEATFEKALRNLSVFAKTEKYHVYLVFLIQEGVKEFSTGKLLVYVNSTDKAWLSSGNLDRLSRNLKVKLALADETEDCIGGCKIQSSDGKLVFDNTFENRLQQLRHRLRAEIANLLFEKEG